MKLFSVAIVALALVSGCGVGADESLDALGVSATPLEQGGSSPGLTGVSQVPVATTGTTLRDPSMNALPQDPIPVKEGRSVPTVDPNAVLKWTR